jgi:predicted methyltransferase
MTRRDALALSVPLIGMLAGCQPAARGPDGAIIEPGSLEWAAAGEWRIEPERDEWRHPIEMLRFWGVESSMTVLEILPGRGWLTAVLAPYLARGGGRLIVASQDPVAASPARRATLEAFDARFADERRFGMIERAIVSDRPSVLALPDSVDAAILANNLHTLLAEGAAERVFGQVFEALKPGGVFGVEQHRAASNSAVDPIASTGYVQEAYVKELAEEVGLEFVAASDMNANPRDTRDHPFGVWTLPPVLRTSPLGAQENPDFDTSPYVAIGESDRMTLKFRKPRPPGQG